jgi:hypothetical protein
MLEGSVVGDQTGCRNGRRVAADLFRSWCGVFCVVVGELGLALSGLAAFGVTGARRWLQGICSATSCLLVTDCGF